MQSRFSILPVDRLSIAVTSYFFTSSPARLEPIKPEPPVTTTFIEMVSLLLSAEIPALYGLQQKAALDLLSLKLTLSAHPHLSHLQFR